MRYVIAVRMPMSRTLCCLCRVVPPRNEKSTAYADSSARAGWVGRAVLGRGRYCGRAGRTARRATGLGHAGRRDAGGHRRAGGLAALKATPLGSTFCRRLVSAVDKIRGSGEGSPISARQPEPCQHGIVLSRRHTGIHYRKDSNKRPT